MDAIYSVIISMPVTCSEIFYSIVPDISGTQYGCKVTLYSDSQNHIGITSHDPDKMVKVIRSIGRMISLSYHVMQGLE